MKEDKQGIDLGRVIIDDDVLDALERFQKGFARCCIDEMDYITGFLLEHHSTGTSEQMMETMEMLSSMASIKKWVRKLIPGEKDMDK